MKKMKLLLFVALAGIADWFAPKPAPVALANELGGLFDHGRETLAIDPAAALPVASKYLGYMRGSTQYYGKPWDGGSGASSFPLGISPDAPYQVGDFMDVERLGATKGTQLALSAGAVTIDKWVYAAANGLVGDLSLAANGTYWVIGKATKTVAAASQEITFLPQVPALWTVSGNPANTYALATPV